MTHIAIVDVLTRKVVGLRRRGGYEQIGPMIGEMVEFARIRGIRIIGPPVLIHHEAMPEDGPRAGETGTADIEVAFPIAGDAVGEGDISVYDLPGGTMARNIYMGAYPGIGDAYKQIFAWLAANGKRVAGPMREVYVNDPGDTPQEDLITWIYAPIEEI
jgi:AraC family transcriptional regulator